MRNRHFSINGHARPSTTRQGIVLIAVLVCLGLVTGIVLGALQTSIRLRRQVARELAVEQARWLVDAGLRRGMSRLTEQPDYEGESLTLMPDLKTGDGVQIEIKVDRTEQVENQIRLTAIARLGDPDQSQAVQRSREIVLDLP